MNFNFWDSGNVLIYLRKKYVFEYGSLKMVLWSRIFSLITFL